MAQRNQDQDLLFTGPAGSQGKPASDVVVLVDGENTPKTLGAALQVGGGGLRYEPFFGDKSVLWSRPGFDIGGASDKFNIWLNQTGDPNVVGLGNLTTEIVSPSFPALSVSPGTGFVPADTITFSGGTIITVVDTQIVSAEIVSAGTLGTPGTAFVSGTTGVGDALFALQVTIGAGGGLESIDFINDPGSYTTNPTNLAVEPLDGGDSGLTGATVILEMGARSATVSTGGTVQSNPAAQSASSGDGVNSTWMLYFNARAATASDGSNGAPLVLQFDVAYTQQSAGDPFGLLKPVGAAPYTITCGLAVPAVGNLLAYPIILYDSTRNSGVMLTWYTVPKLDFNFQLELEVFTDCSVAQSAQYHYTLQSLSGQSYFQWFRVENDGTNLIFSLSYENVVYTEVFRKPLAQFDMAFDKAGFGAPRYQYGGTVGNYTLALWNWVTEFTITAAAASPTNTFTVAGDQTAVFTNGATFHVTGTATYTPIYNAHNDAAYSVGSSIFSAGLTTISINENIPESLNYGTIRIAY